MKRTTSLSRAFKVDLDGGMPGEGTEAGSFPLTEAFGGGERGLEGVDGEDDNMI